LSTGSPSRSYRAAVADDHQLLRSLLIEQLIELGHTVVGEAANGVEIVKIVEREHPDIAVIDVGLPLQDGWAAARQIAELSPTAVLLLSGMSLTNDPEHDARLALAHAYLAKPYLMEELNEALDQAVRRFQRSVQAR